MVDRVGQQLGNYRLVNLLGQGGSASVYLGQHVRFKQKAAIKVLHAHLSELEVEHFQQEAETIAILAHPSIIRVLDFDVQDGVPFLVMDYAPNGTLRQRYPKGSLVPMPVIISSVKQVADALQYAHEQKFIHRDVKPENMLIGRRQEVMLSDYGIATIVHSTSSLGVGAEGTFGTLAYMAPEQIEGHPRPASDQYALGIVVYEWLCGERPFEGSVSELIAQHLSMPPPALRERVSAILAEVEQVVLRSLAKDPKQRFASVQDFALALEVASTIASTGLTRPVLPSEYAVEARLTTKQHLPAYLTPLIGREQEVVAASALLRRPEVRLVTLTGTGGTGKTRLGIQIAAELGNAFPDGVYFVNLASIAVPEVVVPTIAQIFGVKEIAEQPLLDLLKAYLREKHLLLLLDNFEQVLSAAVDVAELLIACQTLKVIVTSRAALHVRGEQEFFVPPLQLPDPKHLPDLVALSEYEAVALFIQRAQAVKPDFKVSNANAPAVAEICVRLDGLPLAIELAAARVKVLPPPALLARLGKRLTMLTSRTQDAPARQQTLRNTIDWSYNLFDAQEQRLFRWLSVFVGGCTLEAVEAICFALDSASTAGQVIEGVASLVDKNLLQQIEQKYGEPRFVMLETIREYGLEVLALSEETEALREAHAAYYLVLAEKTEPELRYHQRAIWEEQIEYEYDNLLAAWQWVVEKGKTGQHVEMVLRLYGVLLNFSMGHSNINEGSIFIKRVLSLIPFKKGDYVTMQSLIKEIRYQLGAALWLALLAKWSAILGNYATARALYMRSLTLASKVGDNRDMAPYLEGLGEVVASQGETTWAARLWGSAEALRERMDTPIWPMEYTKYERSVAAVRASLGEKAFAAAWAEGRGMIPEQAIAAQGSTTVSSVSTIVEQP